MANEPILCMDDRGRVTIPKDVRESYDPDQQFRIKDEDGKIVLNPVTIADADEV